MEGFLQYKDGLGMNQTQQELVLAHKFVYILYLFIYYVTKQQPPIPGLKKMENTETHKTHLRHSYAPPCSGHVCVLTHC